MSKLSNLIILGAALGLSVATYAAPDIQNNNPKNDPAANTALVENNKVMNKININTADEKQLMTVKGIGPKKAKAIIDYRLQNGNFKYLDDLLKVKVRGINKKWLDKVAGGLSM